MSEERKCCLAGKNYTKFFLKIFDIFDVRGHFSKDRFWLERTIFYVDFTIWVQRQVLRLYFVSKFKNS